MVCIRFDESQLLHFREKDESRFSSELWGHLKEFWPEYLAGIKASFTADRFLDSMLREARKIGLSRRKHVIRFADLCAACGYEVGRSDPAAISPALANLSAPADQRLEEAERHLMQRAALASIQTGI